MHVVKRKDASKSKRFAWYFRLLHQFLSTIAMKDSLKDINTLQFQSSQLGKFSLPTALTPPTETHLHSRTLGNFVNMFK